MKSALVLVTIAMVNFVSPTWAADTVAPYGQNDQNRASMNSMNFNKEDREKMAASHAEMASCLRSDQEVIACHAALKEDCSSMMGGACGDMHDGKTMHKGTKTTR